MQSSVIIITGAAGGIGLAIAKAFLSAGYTVVILDLEQDSVDAAIARIG